MVIHDLSCTKYYVMSFQFIISLSFKMPYEGSATVTVIHTLLMKKEHLEIKYLRRIKSRTESQVVL